MNGIKSVRKKLSLSQDEMALFLGISRAMVSHCENGRKQLSTAALQRLSNMEIILNEAKNEIQYREAAEDKLINDHYEKSRSNPDPKLRMHALKTVKLQRHLLTMKKKYGAITSQLEVTNKLEEKAGKANIKENVFLNMLQTNLFGKFSKINPTMQLALKAKIFGRMREYEVLNGEYEL